MHIEILELGTGWNANLGHGFYMVYPKFQYIVCSNIWNLELCVGTFQVPKFMCNCRFIYML